MADIAAMDIVIGAKISGATAGLETVQKELVDTATAAAKVDSALDAVSHSFDVIGKVAIKAAASFESVSAEVFSAADAFNAKWNPIVEQAAQEAAKATTQVNNLAASVAKFGGGVRTFTPNLAAFGAVLPKAGEATSKMAKGTANATTALFNFGRVVQDAPFGILGIANNIDPLVQSFQSLRASTGSTGAALKAMAGGLMGPAGIGIAISAVTSLLIVFGDEIFNTSKAAKELKSVSDVLSEAIGGSRGKIAEVTALSQVLTDSNETLHRRQAALQELVKIDKEHFGQIKIGKTSYEDIKTAVDKYTASLISQARVQGGIAALSEAEAQRLKDLADAMNKVAIVNAETGKGGGVFGQTTARRELVASLKTLGLSTQRVLDLEKLVTDETKNNLTNVELTTKETKKLKDKWDEVGESMKLSRRIWDSMQGLTIAPLFEHVDLGSFNEKLKKSADGLGKWFGEWKKGQADIAKGHAAFMLPDDIFDQVDKFTKKMLDAQSKIKKSSEAMAAIVTAGVVDAFVAIGESIGNLENPLSAIFKILGDTLVILGKQVIISSTLIAAISEALNAAFEGIPVAGIAVGIGLIAVGTFMKGLKHFAEGGIITGPTMGLIGEKGPEVVFPLDRLREFMGGTNQVIVLETRVRGDDLYLINQRTAARRGRNY